MLDETFLCQKKFPFFCIYTVVKLKIYDIEISIYYFKWILNIKFISFFYNKLIIEVIEFTI